MTSAARADARQSMERTSSPTTYSRSESNSVPGPRIMAADRPSSGRSRSSLAGRWRREVNGGSTRTRHGRRGSLPGGEASGPRSARSRGRPAGRRGAWVQHGVDAGVLRAVRRRGAASSRPRRSGARRRAAARGPRPDGLVTRRDARRLAEAHRQVAGSGRVSERTDPASAGRRDQQASSPASASTVHPDGSRKPTTRTPRAPAGRPDRHRHPFLPAITGS
jgi:hypothetical protein